VSAYGDNISRRQLAFVLGSLPRVTAISIPQKGA